MALHVFDELLDLELGKMLLAILLATQHFHALFHILRHEYCCQLHRCC